LWWFLAHPICILEDGSWRKNSLQHNIFHVPDNRSFRDAAAAILVLHDRRYLMQLRDDIRVIFYPGHCGLFGGASEPEEDAEAALRRELKEELDYSPEAVSYFASLKFDFERLGASRCVRLFYEVQLPPVLYKLAALTLAEGHSMAPLEIADLLLSKRVVPYDSFAIWMHNARRMQIPSVSTSVPRG
jgi:8-oxo-dGTP pyrophosphatase MutT (NUDIX family)